MHNSGRGARYTSGRRPVRLVYSESFDTVGDALKREYQLKQWPRGKKEALIVRMTLRKQFIELLSQEPRSISSIAREMGLHRRDAEDDLRHALRSAVAAGHKVEVIPARCKSCGFVFDDGRLTKPGRCPSCKGSRLFEPLIQLRA
jgi:predicted Zn-ribbon and HTH transcriptional regulator